MNAQELRKALFNVGNQGMTVAQLRDLLFHMEQDQELYMNFDIVEKAQQSKQEPVRRSPSDRTPMVDVELAPRPVTEPMRRPIYDPASVSMNPDGTIGKGKRA
jgi:hypothetical protein